MVRVIQVPQSPPWVTVVLGDGLIIVLWMDGDSSNLWTVGRRGGRGGEEGARENC